MTADRRRRLTSVLGVAGAAAGMLAGVAQATVGRSIPEWSGAKASPLALGLLTVGLSLLAGGLAVWQRRGGLSVWQRLGCALGMAVPGLLCLSTVGRLWYPAFVLLVAAAVLCVENWPATARAAAADWWRILLGALGGIELLMAAGAAPLTLVVGVVGGLALIAAASSRKLGRGGLVALVVIGTAPFAVVAWFAVVPLLWAPVAVAVAVPVLRSRPELAGQPVAAPADAAQPGGGHR